MPSKFLHFSKWSTHLQFNGKLHNSAVYLYTASIFLERTPCLTVHVFSTLRHNWAETTIGVCDYFHQGVARREETNLSWQTFRNLEFVVAPSIRETISFIHIYFSEPSNPQPSHTFCPTDACSSSDRAVRRRTTTGAEKTRKIPSALLFTHPMRHLHTVVENWRVWWGGGGWNTTHEI